VDLIQAHWCFSARQQQQQQQEQQQEQQHQTISGKEVASSRRTTADDERLQMDEIPVTDHEQGPTTVIFHADV
jgi:hypothetical protein